MTGVRLFVGAETAKTKEGEKTETAKTKEREKNRNRGGQREKNAESKEREKQLLFGAKSGRMSAESPEGFFFAV